MAGGNGNLLGEDSGRFDVDAGARKVIVWHSVVYEASETNFREIGVNESREL